MSTSQESKLPFIRLVDKSASSQKSLRSDVPFSILKIKSGDDLTNEFSEVIVIRID